jgi:putative transposase
MEADECADGAGEVRARAGVGRVDDERAVRAPWRVATDGVQVGESVQGRRRRRAEGAESCSAWLSASNGDQDRGTRRALEEDSRLGRTKASSAASKAGDCCRSSRSTVFDILKRHGLVKSRRRRQKWQHPGAAPLHTDAPNEVWTIDFKGQFKTRDGIYCYPLTLLDHYSRYLLACRALFNVKTAGARATLERVFRAHGLPTAIRSDNGSPFASTGIHGLCGLNVWWMKLGIVHQRITPSSPQENGAHERMHRTLKARATRPPAASLRGQQWKFDRFQSEYNFERPHEALDDEPPASLWTPSQRAYPDRIGPPEYPGHFELRRVSNAGHFRMGAQHYFISHALKDDNIGLEAIDDGLWNILYYNTLLGRLSERSGKISGASFRSDEC